jgi:uncharacterized membrane protein HdeD (DUF308 family)
VALLFGGILLAVPDLSLASFALALGLFALASAVVTLAAATRLPARSLVVRAAIDLALGVLLCVRRPWTALAALDYLAGAWATATGVLEMFAAGVFRRDRPTEWLEAGAGAIAVALGIYLGIFPETLLSPLVRLFGVLELVSGALLLLDASRTSGKL